MSPYLRPTEVIDWQHLAILQQAAQLASHTSNDPLATAAACFEWVRDEIRHSRDFEMNPVTWRASDVLRHRTGYCYAKSHLLAALLRAKGIPAGFCYQRLSVNDAGPPYSLHGFNAVELPDHGWYRVDPRGNRPGIDAQFTPPIERLAFALNSAEEIGFANILPDPLNCIIAALQQSTTWQDAITKLPDVTPHQAAALGLTPR